MGSNYPYPSSNPPKYGRYHHAADDYSRNSPQNSAPYQMPMSQGIQPGNVSNAYGYVPRSMPQQSYDDMGYASHQRQHSGGYSDPRYQQPSMSPTNVQYPSPTSYGRDNSYSRSPTSPTGRHDMYGSYEYSPSPTTPTYPSTDPYSSSGVYTSSHQPHTPRMIRNADGSPTTGSYSSRPPESYVVPSMDSPPSRYLPQNSPTSDRFPCDYCDKTFSRSHDRKRHCETHHSTNPPVHRCPKCGREFGRGDSLKRHKENGACAGT